MASNREALRAALLLADYVQHWIYGDTYNKQFGQDKITVVLGAGSLSVYVFKDGRVRSEWVATVPMTVSIHLLQSLIREAQSVAAGQPVELDVPLCDKED